MSTDLDPDIADAVRNRWPNRGPAWSEALPTELNSLCVDLGVAIDRTFTARYAYVARVRTPAGASMVLRSTPDPDADHQAAVLRRLTAVGLAPHLHAVHHTRTATWTVMDAVTPGTSLDADPGRNRRAPGLIATLRVLAAEHDGPVDIPDLVPWITARLTAPPADDLPPGRHAAPESVRARALNALAALGPPPAGQLCHGDLSPGNILTGSSQLWLIDPRGINGEPAYDIAVAALKAARNNATSARPVAAELAEATGADPHRSASWVPIAAAASV